MRELARGWEERLRAAARTSWSRDVRVGTEDGVRFGDVRDALAALDVVRAEAESLRAASDEADEAREALAEAQNRIGWYADQLADVEEQIGGEFARIAAALDAERVRWVRSALSVPSPDTSSAGFFIRVNLVARGLGVSFDEAVRVYDAARADGATDAVIAAAIRAACEVKP